MLSINIESAITVRPMVCLVQYLALVSSGYWGG